MGHHGATVAEGAESGAKCALTPPHGLLVAPGGTQKGAKGKLLILGTEGPEELD